jgi:purine-binding chemotaxis protein CheW
MRPDDSQQTLVCRVLNRLCALPLRHVIETMRPLDIKPMAGVPRPVAGVAIIRGAAVAVVDLSWVLAEEESHPTRFVVVRVDGRRVALTVDAVVGVRTIPSGSVNDLPPLVRDASIEAIATIGTLDAELLVVLGDGRLLPESLWDAIAIEEPSP